MNRRDVEFLLGDELSQKDIDFIFDNETNSFPTGHGDYKVVSFLDGEGALFQAENTKTGKRYGCCYSVASARELCKQLNADDQLAKLGF
jgi:hypothetical protein